MDIGHGVTIYKGSHLYSGGYIFATGLHGFFLFFFLFLFSVLGSRAGYCLPVFAERGGWMAGD